jgi:MFS family permease
VARFILPFLALGLLNVGLGLFLLISAAPVVARADGMDEAMLGGLALVVAVGLILFASPALWWGFTAARRERKANLIRLAVATWLSLATFVPVLLTVLSFAR